MLEAGQEFVKVTLNEDESDFVVSVDRSKIASVGLPALKNFLMKLNVYKSLADLVSGTEMFNRYSKVDSEDLKVRDIYIKNKKPRSEFIQPTILESKEYVSYENSNVGMLQSFVDKYPAK